MATRQNQCHSCGGWGHNRRACPQALEIYERIEKLAKKYDHCPTDEERRYGNAGWIQKLRTKIVDTVGDTHEDASIVYSDIWKWSERAERIAYQKLKKEQGGRRCGFCNNQGHNARTCDQKKVHVKQCNAVRSLAHRLCRAAFEHSGLVPGALVEYQRYDYGVGKYRQHCGVVQKINWDVIAEQDENTQGGINNAMEQWMMRGHTLTVLDHNNDLQHLATPRNIVAQTEYHYDENPTYKLLNGIKGASVNTTGGYLGDNVEDLPDMGVWIWGKEFLDTEFGEKVDTLLKEVSAKLRTTF